MPAGDRDAYEEHAGLHLGGDLEALADGVTVELHRHRLLGADDDLAAGEATELFVGTALASEHAHDDREPADESLGREHHDVERAVVDLRVGQQRDAGLQEADVADDDGAGLELLELAVVDRDLHLHRGIARGLDAGDEVREPADLLLELVVDAVHDHGVHAEPGHHQEAGVGAGVGLVGAEVDRPVLAAERDIEGIAGVERYAEVAGQQVAGAVREDADGDARTRHFFTHRAHRAVAAGGEDQVDLGLERGERLAVAGILDRRLEPQRLAPAVARRRPYVRAP